MKKAMIILILILSFALVSCGGSDDPETTDNGGAGNDTEKTEDTEPTDDNTDPVDNEPVDNDPVDNEVTEEPVEETPDVDNGPVVEVSGDDYLGTYIGKKVISTISKNPMTGAEEEGVNTIYTLTTITKEGDDYIATEQSCTSITDDPNITVDDSINPKITPKVGKLTFFEEGDAIKVSREDVAVGVSVNLDDPINDELSTEKDDPRVFDLDEDGHPGITIKISVMGINGEMYSIRKDWDSWTTEIDSEGIFTGTIVDNSSSVILDASNAMFKVDVEAWQNPDLSASPIKLVPVEEGYDCDAVKANYESIFGD